MPNLLPPKILILLRLLVVIVVVLEHATTGSYVQGAEEAGKPFISELKGLDPGTLIQQTVRVDFRPLTIKDVETPRVDVELNYDLEVANSTSAKDISFYIPASASVARLLLDSSSLTFRSSAATGEELRSDLGENSLLTSGASQIQQCKFDATISAGKHRLVVGLHIPIKRSDRNRYELAYLCPHLNTSKELQFKLQYAVPDYWQFSVDDRTQVGTESQIEINISDIKDSLSLVALENYPWDLNSKVAIQSVYEFDRRFSITGWIFMTAIAATAFLAAAIVWFQGGSQTAYGSLLLCGILAVVGLGAALVLPKESNQMRVIRQQDHDEIVMLANRLLLDQLRNKPESVGEVVDVDLLPRLGDNMTSPGSQDVQDLTPALVSLMRHSKAVHLGDCFVSLEELADKDALSKLPSGIHYVVLRDGPSTLSLYELKVDGNATTCRLVATSPVPTTMRMGAAISDEDVTEFHKGILADYLK